jgi:hypothetical protein
MKLSNLQKIIQGVRRDDSVAEPTPSGLFASVSLPFIHTLPKSWNGVADEEKNQALAQWNELSAALTTQDFQVSKDAFLQLHIALGEIVWQNRKLPKGQILQVHARHKLLAIIDSRSMRAHVRPHIEPKDAEKLISSTIAPERVHIPPAFHNMPLWDVLWQYAYHHPSASQQVPTELAHRALHLRRLPLTSTHVLPDSAMQVIGVLVNNDLSFGQLQSMCGLLPEELMRCVLALHLTRSLQLAVK